MHIGAPLPAALVVPRPIALVGPDSIVNAGEKFTLKRQSFAEWRTENGANAAAERAEAWVLISTGAVARIATFTVGRDSGNRETGWKSRALARIQPIRR